MRRGEYVLVGEDRPHAVAALDLVGVRDRLAGQHAGVGAQAGDLVAQPAVLERVEERLRLGEERRGVGERLGCDRRCQLGRAEVRVDEPVHVTAESQPEPQIPLRGIGHELVPRASASNRPVSYASTTACTRSRSPSFWRMCVTCVLTVVSPT